jgi:anthranilate 1,2-dioxygenase small subunit
MANTLSTAYRKSSVDPARALVLRSEIEIFNAEYCALLDSGHVESWPDFFTEDCIYRVTARENADLNMPVGLVYAEGRRMLHDRAIAISRTQMFAPRYMLHLVTNVRILEEEKGGDILAQANFLLLQTLIEGPTTVHMAGAYYDRFKRAAQGLLLQERQVVYDTSIIANDLVYPV